MQQIQVVFIRTAIESSAAPLETLLPHRRVELLLLLLFGLWNRWKFIWDALALCSHQHPQRQKANLHMAITIVFVAVP